MQSRDMMISWIKSVAMVAIIVCTIRSQDKFYGTLGNRYAYNNGSIPTSGLVAFYPFNSNANDASGNDHHGVQNGIAPTFDRYGNTASAFAFGHGSHVQIPHHPDLNINIVSISLWFKADTITSSYQYILRKRNDDYGSMYGVALYDRQLLFEVNEWNDFTVNADIQKGVWYHALVIYDSSHKELSMYLDGVLKYQRQAPIYSLQQSSRPLFVGGSSWQGISGALDDIRIYNRVLSPQEIFELANEKTEPLLCYLEGSAIANGVSLEWTKANAQSSNKYRVLVDTISPPNAVYRVVNDINDTTLTVSNLTNGTTYHLQIEILNVSDSILGISNEISIIPHVNENGLIAYYSFTGNAIDETGNGNDGSIVNALLTEDRYSNYNSAYYFGGNSKITIPDNPVLYSGNTISLWICPDTVPVGNQGIIKKDFSVSLVDSQIQFEKNLWSDNSNHAGIKSKKWHHVVVSYDVAKESLRIFVDAAIRLERIAPVWRNIKPDYPRERNTLSRLLLTSDGYISIGGSSSQNGFRGKIDDIRIYNEILSPNRVQELFLEENAPRNLKGKEKDKKIILTWDRINAMSLYGYHIYGGTSPNPISIVDSTNAPNDTTIVIDGLQNNTVYYFRIRGVFQNQTMTGFSKEVALRPHIEKPDQFYSLTKKDSVVIHWNAVEGGVRYFVLRGNDSASMNRLVVTNDTSYVDINLVSSKRYYYRVYGVDSDSIPGDTSLSVRAVTLPASVNKIIVGNVTDKAIELSWPDTLNYDKQYNLYRVLIDSGSTSVISSRATHFTDSTVEAATSYRYSVKALNQDSVESESSDTISVTTKVEKARIQFLEIPTQQRNKVRIPFNIYVGKSDTTKIEIWYSIDGGTTYHRSNDILSEEQYYTSSQNDTLDWNSIIDIKSETDSCIVRLVPRGKGGYGISITSALFPLDNKAPSHSGLLRLQADSNGTIVTLNWPHAFDKSGPIRYSLYSTDLSKDPFKRYIVDSLIIDTLYSISDLKTFHNYKYDVHSEDYYGNYDSVGLTSSIITMRSIKTLAVSVPSRTLRDNVEVSFILDGANEDTANIALHYSVNNGTSWSVAGTVSGQYHEKVESGIIKKIIWNSRNDYQMESDSTILRIAPVGRSGNGIMGVSQIFTLDNQAPRFDGLKKVISDTAGVKVHLEWSKADDISRPVSYRVFVSNDTTTLHHEASIDTVVYDTTYSHTGVIPFKKYYYSIRSIDSIGNSDSNRIIHSVIPSQLLATTFIGTPTFTGRIKVPIRYTLTGALADTANIVMYHSTNAGASWNKATAIYGSVANVTTYGVENTLYWDALLDIPNTENSAMKVRIIPMGRAGIGRAGESGLFSIDTKEPQFNGIQSVEWDTKQSGQAVIRWSQGKDTSNPILYYIHRYDGNIDHGIDRLDSTYLIEYRATKLAYSTKYYFKVNAKDAVGNQDTNKVVRNILIPPLSDFNGDSRINAADLAIFRNAWKTQSIEFGDIGPANGTPPYLQPIFDRTIDFEDLMVFGRMWNWTIDSPQGYALFNKNSRNDSTISLGFTEPTVLPPNQQRKFTLRLKREDSIAAVDYLIEYDSTNITIDSVDTGKISEYLSFSRIHNQSDFVRISVVALNDTIERDYPNEFTVKLSMHTTEKLEKSPLVVKVRTYTHYGQFYSDAMLTTLLNWRPLIPEAFNVSQNYPNPFNPSTRIDYQLPTDDRISLKVYNILGQEVATLFDGVKEAGYHSVYWDAAKMASGIYVYRLFSRGHNISKKMILLK